MYIPAVEHITDLYHGTDCNLSKPSLAFSRPIKDFGTGFYTTTDFSQAKDFAIMKARRNKTDSRYVHEFAFNSKGKPLNNLRIKRFATPDIELINYVIINRLRNVHSFDSDVAFDIIIGPVANQIAGPIIQNLLQNVYGNLTTDGDRAKSFAISLLDAERLENQVVFCTERALEVLGTVVSSYTV